MTLGLCNDGRTKLSKIAISNFVSGTRGQNQVYNLPAPTLE